MGRLLEKEDISGDNVLKGTGITMGIGTHYIFMHVQVKEGRIIEFGR